MKKIKEEIQSHVKSKEAKALFLQVMITFR